MFMPVMTESIFSSLWGCVQGLFANCTPSSQMRTHFNPKHKAPNAEHWNCQTFVFYVSNLLPSCFCIFVMFSPVFLKPRDILPFTIKLPDAIASAKTQKELEEVAQLGAGTVVFFIALWFKLILLLNNHSFDFAFAFRACVRCEMWNHTDNSSLVPKRF